MTAVSTMRKPQAYSYFRLSTDVQLKGSGLARQMQLSRSYAAEHGLELVEDFDLYDIGVSAYSGANLRVGALGRFREAVQQGRIARGSYLLVELLDRVSRQNVWDAMALFMELIRSGIVIVTFQPHRIYDRRTGDITSMMEPLVYFCRANEEFATKSFRLLKAWENKRRAVSDRKLTGRCPAWLKLDPDKTKFEPIPEKVELVRRILRESAAGIGAYSIARRLNEEGVPTFGKSRGWQISYVLKISIEPRSYRRVPTS